MDIGNIGDSNQQGLYCREVAACSHVGINVLMLPATKNFYVTGSAYIVFEEGLCKVVCPACLLKGSTSAA